MPNYRKINWLNIKLPNKFKPNYRKKSSFFAEKDHSEVELALQDVNKPIGVAEYQYLLPKNKLQELVTNEMKNSSNDDD